MQGEIHNHTLLQFQIYAWAREKFPTQNAVSVLNHLKKEVKELIESNEQLDIFDEENKTSYTGKGESAKKRIELTENIREEFADCFILLMEAAAYKGYTMTDIFEACQAKFEKNKARKWGKPDSDGVVEHIDE